MADTTPTHTSAMWRRLDVHGLEHFRFRLETGGPRLAGTVLLAIGMLLVAGALRG